MRVSRFKHPGRQAFYRVTMGSGSTYAELEFEVPSRSQMKRRIREYLVGKGEYYLTQRRCSEPSVAQEIHIVISGTGVRVQKKETPSQDKMTQKKRRPPRGIWRQRVPKGHFGTQR